MAAYDTLRLLQNSHPPLFSLDRQCCARLRRRKAWHRVASSSPLSLQHPRGWALWTCTHAKLICACSRSSNVVVMAFENFPGRVDTVVDAGIEVSNLEFFPDILDIRFRENNRAAPPVMPYYPPSDGHGPSELDFEIYASNSMENYEPPPPPRIPFGFPFEDYYDEAIGIDYISKEEKPASSLLELLGFFNTKKAEGGGENTKKPLLSQGAGMAALDTTEGKPLFPQSRLRQRVDGSINRSTDVQDDSRPIHFTVSSPQAKADLEQNVLSSLNRTMEESSEQLPVLSHVSRSRQSSGVFRPSNAQNNTAPDTWRPLSPIVSTTAENQDPGRCSSSQARSTEQPMDSTVSLLSQTRSSREFKGGTIAFSPSYGLAEEGRVEGNAPLSSSTRLSEDTRDAHISTLPQAESIEQIKGNLGQILLQTRNDEVVSERRSGQSIQQNLWTAEASGLHVNQMETGRPSLTNPATSSQALDSSRETKPKLRFYEPREGDLILGVVTFINDQKVDLEIGADLCALMPLRDLQPLPQNVDNMFFEIPVTIEDSPSVPFGKSLIVKDKTAFDGLSRNGIVDIGTVVIAEVMGRTIIDGRAVLSCKSPAQRLAWHRIEQLMRLGEVVQLEIVQWNEGGLLGYFEGVRAFVPRSELLQKPESTSVLKSYVGRTLPVVVLQTDRQKSNMIASEIKAWMSKNLQLGTVHDVTVTRVHSYGMQVEVDNTKIRGFVHKTNFSNEYVSSVTNYFAEGDKARVMLIKGRNPGQISFGLTDLEKENGLLLRDKGRVFQDAEEMGRKFRERLSEQEREIFGVAVSGTNLDYQDPGIANLAWLHV